MCWAYPECIILEIQQILYYLNYDLGLVKVMFHECIRKWKQNICKYYVFIAFIFIISVNHSVMLLAVHYYSRFLDLRAEIQE